MQYLEIGVRTARIIHGFDDENREIVEEVNEETFTKKIILLPRIQSISEKYLLVNSSHGRVMYWEYEGSMDEVQAKLQSAGLLLS